MAKKMSVNEIIAEERERQRARDKGAENRALKEQLDGAASTIRKLSNAGKRGAVQAYNSGIATGGAVAGLAGLAVFVVEWILSRFLPAAYAKWGKWIVLAVSTMLVAGGYMLAMPVLLWAGIISALLTGILWTLGRFGVIRPSLTIQGEDTEIGATDDASEYLEMDEMDFMEIGAAAADDLMEAETAGKTTPQQDIEAFWAGIDEWVRNGMSPLGLPPLAAKGIVIFGPRVVDLIKALRDKIKAKKKGGKVVMNRKPSEVLRTAMAVREHQNRLERARPTPVALPLPGQPMPTQEQLRSIVDAAVAEKRAEWEKSIQAIRANTAPEVFEPQPIEAETFGVDEIDGVEGVDFDTIEVNGVKRRRPRPGRRVVRTAKAKSFASAARRNQQAANSSSSPAPSSASSQAPSSVSSQAPSTAADLPESDAPSSIPGMDDEEDPTGMFTSGMSAEDAIAQALNW